MTKKKDNTFLVDKFLLLKSPEIFATQRRHNLGQGYVPGMVPLIRFDHWSTLALYYYLDKKNPTAPKFVKLADLMRLLRFAKDDQAPGFSSDQYSFIEESLHRLRSIAIEVMGEYERPTYDRKLKRRVKRQFTMVSNDPIVISLIYVYEGGLQATRLLKDQIYNANTVTVTNTGYKPPEILKVEGRRPIGVMYQLNPQVIMGITKASRDNIGAVITPQELFDMIRTPIGDTPTTVRLMDMVLVQNAKRTKRHIDNIAENLNLPKEHPGRNRERILTGFEQLKEYGAIEDYLVEGDFVTWEKSDKYHFAAKSKTPALPAP